MFICANTDTTIKLGPVTDKSGKAFNRKRLFHKEVLFSINAGSLANFASQQDIPADLDGYYNLKLPPLTPGNLMIIVQLDGHPEQAFHYTVLSKHGYGRMFSNEIQSVNAVNVPIENGYVKTDPNLIVGVDFEKCLNLDAKLVMPNTFLGGVGKVASPHITDLSPVVSAIRDHAKDTDTRIERLRVGINSLGEYLEKLDPIGENQRTTINYMKELLAHTQELAGAVKVLDTRTISDQLVDIIKRLCSAADFAQQAKLTIDDIDKSIGSAVEDLPDMENISAIITSLVAISERVAALKIPTVEEITGGGPLDTKDGRMRLVNGTGEGEIELEEGLVHASDVKHKSGYRLAKDGLGSITACLENCIRDECQKLQPPAPKNVAQQHHHG